MRLLSLSVMLLLTLPCVAMAAPEKAAPGTPAQGKTATRPALSTRPAATTRPATTRPAGAARPAPLPTEAEIRAAFDRGDYRGALEQLSRVLGRKDKAVAGYNRYELTLLKA